MTLQEIKDAVNSGKKVYYHDLSYEVILGKNNQWLIKCTINGMCIGLTWADDVTLNGKESDFFIK